MKKPAIAVLCGGTAAERNISLESGEVVCQQLDALRFEPYKIIVNQDVWLEENSGQMVDLNHFSVLIDGKERYFDAAFIAIHGSPGEDGKIQGYLDMKGIPYTCCNTVVASITFNKSFCKQVLQGRAIMAKGVLLQQETADPVTLIQDSLRLPLFVKPNNNGSSYGISRITEWGALLNALADSFQYDHEILVEEAISGTEVTCGAYLHQGEVIVLPICEIVADKHGFFNYTAKYTTGESQEIIPARIPDEQAEKVIKTTASIYSFLGCQGVVRIDYIIQDGEPYFLEVNTVPGLSGASIVPQMVVASGLSLTEFFTRLLEESL